MYFPMIYDATSAIETKWWFGDFYQLPASLVSPYCLFASGSQWPFVNILPRWEGGGNHQIFPGVGGGDGFWRFLLCFLFQHIFFPFTFEWFMMIYWWFIVCFWDVFLFFDNMNGFSLPFCCWNNSIFVGLAVDCWIGVESWELGDDTVDGSPRPAKPQLMGMYNYIHVCFMIFIV